MHLRSWQLSLIVLVLCGLALYTTHNYRARQFAGHEWLFRRLPTDHAVIVGIDVRALRQAGMLDLLAGSRADEELDYRRFVDQTAFDYRTDLDYVSASISTNSDAKFFALQGRFDWDSLFNTAKQAGGRCMNAFCDLPGFTGGKNLSFLPLSPEVLGLSVSRGNQVAWTLAKDSTGVQLPRVPSYPVFVAMDAGILAGGASVPLPMQPLAEILSSAEYVVIGIDAGIGGRLSLALDADCMSDSSAGVLQNRIQRAVGEGTAVAALLNHGTVSTQGRSVHARWPLDRATLQSIVNP